MKKIHSLIYRSMNHEIHYAMSFIGGGVEIISFIYLYKALIGFMTSNLIFGINTLANGKFDFISIYHILIIVIWMLIAAVHQIMIIKFQRLKMKTPWHSYAIALTINCFLLGSFIILGQRMLTSGAIGAEPTPVVIPLVINGLIFMYIQNFLIKSGGTNHPTTTSVVTTVYILMVTKIVAYFNKEHSQSDRKSSLEEGAHYLMVLLHFSIGAFIIAKLSDAFGFYSLGLMLLVLIFITFKTWRAHRTSLRDDVIKE